jgi:hypothetical protein
MTRIDPNLPANLASEAAPEICKWVLEQHNDAMELEIEMAKRRADVPTYLPSCCTISSALIGNARASCEGKADMRPYGPPPTYLRIPSAGGARGGGKETLPWSSTHGVAAASDPPSAQGVDRQATWVIALLSCAASTQTAPRYRAPATNSRRFIR